LHTYAIQSFWMYTLLYQAINAAMIQLKATVHNTAQEMFRNQCSIPTYQ